MIPSIGKILTSIEECETPEAASSILLQHQNNMVLRDLIKMGMDASVRWLLPQGAPPYKPSPFIDVEGMIYKNLRMFHAFLEQPQPSNMRQLKREQLFVEVLETVHPLDAKWIIRIKDRIMPKCLTYDVINAIWPGLIVQQFEKVEGVQETPAPLELPLTQPTEEPKMKRGPSEKMLEALKRARAARAAKRAATTQETNTNV